MQRRPKYRTEHDSMGEVLVREDRLWGAQTQRSLDNFRIGSEKMPQELIEALVIIKGCCARANNMLLPERMTDEKRDLIIGACKEILNDRKLDSFPLSVWQTGSGTQTNMNANEVIAHIGNSVAGEKILHPNDDVNMSQSSNDIFPSAMHVSAYLGIKNRLIPALDLLIDTLLRLEEENKDIIKSGRTHLQDATPVRFSQEISGWRGMLESSREQILFASEGLCRLAVGGTATGTGINAPQGFGEAVARELSYLTGAEFTAEENKFHALSSKDVLAFTHGALSTLASNLLKIANDVRWLASGPRCSIGEINIPANEPGSSIMPGKVNPTQCEAMSMVCLQVMGNNTTVGFAASQGNFQLNVYMPVIIYNFLQSVSLLSDAMLSFDKNCMSGLAANKERMDENLHRSLMTVTALNTYIGYEGSARVARLAYEQDITIKEAVLTLKLMSAEEFDKAFDYNKMV